MYLRIQVHVQWIFITNWAGNSIDSHVKYILIIVPFMALILYKPNKMILTNTFKQLFDHIKLFPFIK
jgi:hypothetical protein